MGIRGANGGRKGGLSLLGGGRKFKMLQMQVAGLRNLLQGGA
jgi:hypothetical protein